MNRRTRKKILRSGYKHPRFAEAFHEEYNISAQEAGKQIAIALNIFCKQVRIACEQIAKIAATYNR